jgi:cytochrome c556
MKNLILTTLFLASSASAQHHHHHHHATGPDQRKPVPMTAEMAAHQLSNMRDHLQAIHGVVASLAKKDFAGVKAAAAKLASSPEMTMMCKNLGQGVEGFTQMGLAFHSSGDDLVAAAEKKDEKLILAKLERTLNTCTTCHAAFRQQITTPDGLESFRKALSPPPATK